MLPDLPQTTFVSPILRVHSATIIAGDLAPLACQCGRRQGWLVFQLDKAGTRMVARSVGEGGASNVDPPARCGLLSGFAILKNWPALRASFGSVSTADSFDHNPGGQRQTSHWRHRGLQTIEKISPSKIERHLHATQRPSLAKDRQSLP